MTPMLRFSGFAALCCLLFAAAPRPVRAQGLDVQAWQQPSGSAVPVADGGAFVMTARSAPGSVDAGIAVRSRTGSEITLTGIALAGSAEFSLRDLPAFPVSLAASRSQSFQVRFAPLTAGRSTSRLVISFMEGQRAGTFTVNLTGTAADIVVSYMLLPAGNAVLLGAGASVAFPQTNVGATATATVTIANRGSGAATVQGVSLAGEDFGLGGLSLLPAALDGGRELRFNVLFLPRRIGAAKGGLEISIDGIARQHPLEGTGAGSLFRYEMTAEAGVTPLQPGHAAVLPDTPVGQKSQVRVRVSNQGNAEGKVAAIGVAGAGFAVSDTPFLPATVAPGASFTFTLSFNPPQPGPQQGGLRIGDDTFELKGMGIGSALAFQYRAGGETFPLANNGSILFSPLPVGKTSSVSLVASNTGTAPATVTVIGISGGGGPAFTLAGLPELPARVAAGESLVLEIGFAPAVVGAVTAALRIDNYAFTLSGAGAAPPALSSYRLDGCRAEEPPMQQLSLSLALAEPYELRLTGTLTLEHSSDVFGSDPSVQFATGGRSVAFSIPAGATRAVFQNQSEAVRLQTGSVAGTISLRAAFAAGQVDVTPGGVAATSIQVASTPPKVLSAAIAARTTNGFTLQVTGFAPTRALARMDFEFTPAAGVTMSAQKASLNVEAAFVAWYQSQQSQPYGSLFTASVPFTLQGTVSGGQALLDSLEAVTVTLANPAGTSDPVSTGLK